jgi:uncharacterized repeat protein (TIGR01451 family)
VTPTPTSSISIAKTARQPLVTKGGSETFSITVTNTGQTQLTNVVVSDALSPVCNKQIGTLAPGQSVTYSCKVAHVTKRFTNVAVVRGTTPTGGTLSAKASAPVELKAPFTPPVPKPVVKVVHPKITITKGPKSQTVAHGGTATFTISVENRGDVTLHDVVVRDQRTPDCSRSIGTLAPGAGTSYTCVQRNVTASFQNVAVVTGKSPTGQSVKAQDHADVKAAPYTPPAKPKVVSHAKPKTTG